MGEEKGGGYSNVAEVNAMSKVFPGLGLARRRDGVVGEIFPTEHIGPTSKQGTLVGHTFADVSDILGFKPNKPDDPDSVDGGKSWAFQFHNAAGASRGTDDLNCDINIWSWKGSGLNNCSPSFSFSGPSSVLASIFGKSYVI
jgi:hypothetical protein